MQALCLSIYFIRLKHYKIQANKENNGEQWEINAGLVCPTGIEHL